jgi:hypothetical protein
MNKLAFHIPKIQLIPDGEPQVDLQPAGRLIVLVPPDADYSSMTHRIWELANRSGNRVLLLSLCSVPAQSTSTYRQLVTMAALMEDGRVVTETHVETGNHWASAVARYYRAGDMVVCFASQRVGLLHKPLSQILQSSLKLPICILSDGHPHENEKTNSLSQLKAWGGSLSLIAGFFLLQARIVMLPADWIQTTLLILTFLAELWLIWLWNGRFG